MRFVPRRILIRTHHPVDRCLAALTGASQYAHRACADSNCCFQHSKCGALMQMQSLQWGNAALRCRGRNTQHLVVDDMHGCTRPQMRTS